MSRTHGSLFLRSEIFAIWLPHICILFQFMLTHFLSSLTSLLFDTTGTNEFKVVTNHIAAIIFHAILKLA
jgi:hypothetical protein